MVIHFKLSIVHMSVLNSLTICYFDPYPLASISLFSIFDFNFVFGFVFILLGFLVLLLSLTLDRLLNVV